MPRRCWAVSVADSLCPGPPWGSRSAERPGSRHQCPSKFFLSSYNSSRSVTGNKPLNLSIH